MKDTRSLAEIEAAMLKTRRFVRVFGKREIEVLAFELLDAGLLEKTFTKEQAIASDPRFLDFEGFDYAVELKWLEASVQRPGVYRCSPAFIERAKNAQAKDRAEGIVR